MSVLWPMLPKRKVSVLPPTVVVGDTVDFNAYSLNFTTDGDNATFACSIINIDTNLTLAVWAEDTATNDLYGAFFSDNVAITDAVNITNDALRWGDPNYPHIYMSRFPHSEDIVIVTRAGFPYVAYFLIIDSSTLAIKYGPTKVYTSVADQEYPTVEAHDSFFTAFWIEGGLIQSFPFGELGNPIGFKTTLNALAGSRDLKSVATTTDSSQLIALFYRASGYIYILIANRFGALVTAAYRISDVAPSASAPQPIMGGACEWNDGVDWGYIASWVAKNTDGDDALFVAAYNRLAMEGAPGREYGPVQLRLEGSNTYYNGDIVRMYNNNYLIVWFDTRFDVVYGWIVDYQLNIIQDRFLIKNGISYVRQVSLAQNGNNESYSITFTNPGVSPTSTRLTVIDHGEI